MLILNHIVCFKSEISLALLTNSSREVSRTSIITRWKLGEIPSGCHPINRERYSISACTNRIWRDVCNRCAAGGISLFKFEDGIWYSWIFFEAYSGEQWHVGAVLCGSKKGARRYRHVVIVVCNLLEFTNSKMTIGTTSITLVSSQCIQTIPSDRTFDSGKGRNNGMVVKGEKRDGRKRGYPN